jgi:beta-glucosidase
LVADSSDVIILALGTNSKGGKCCGSQDGLVEENQEEMAVTSGEGYDLHSIELTPHEQKLFDTVKKSNKPIILLLYGGKPLAITKQVEDCSAILFAFGCGEQGNEAIYDIITGKVNPSGKLPLTFPRSTGHLPCFYNYKPSARGSIYQAPGTPDKPGYDYVFDTPKALFPFGFGLSYTKFSYENLQVEKLGKRSFKVRVTVRNDGEFDGDESVLLFLSQRTQRVTPMVKKLRAFKRISLKKGESQEVCFKMGKADFTFVDVDMKRRVAGGQVRVQIENLQETIVVE